MVNFEKNKEHILKSLKVGEGSLLGKGVESFVYAYGKNQVLKILKQGSVEYLKSLQKLQVLISKSEFSVRTPLIVKISELNGTFYTFEERFDGQNLSKIFDTFSEDQKKKVMLDYFDLLREIANVDVGKFEFGQIAKSKDEISCNSWSDFVCKKVEQKTSQVTQQLEDDVIDFKGKIKVFSNLANTKLDGVEKKLVHGDYFYDNVMANKAAKITGILDFSGWTTVVGDFRLDVCGAIIFLEHSQFFINYQRPLTEIAKSRYSEEIEYYIDFYRLYYSLFLSDSCLYLKPLYDWCVTNLNDNKLWKRVQQ